MTEANPQRPATGAATGNAGVTDPRTVRVRTQLFDAAERLGAEGSPFTVSALVRAAGVSRSVFYVHFDDLADFALALQRVQLDEIATVALAERSDDPERAMLQAQRRLARHFRANQQLYRAVLAMPSLGGMEQGISAAIKVAVRRHFAVAGTMPAELDEAIAASYISQAAAGVLTEWVLGQYDADEERIAQHLFALMPTWMYATKRASSDSQTATGK